LRDAFIDNTEIFFLEVGDEVAVLGGRSIGLHLEEQNRKVQ
jgi:hypothetical protein